MLLMPHKPLKLLLPHLRLRQRDILPAYKPPACRLVNRPRQIRRREHEHPTRIPFPLLPLALLFPRSRTLQIAPLNQKLRLDPPCTLMLATPSPRRKQRIDFVYKNDAGCQGLRELEQRAHELLALAEPFARQAAGGNGEKGALALRRHGPGQHRFAGAGRPEEEHASCGFAQAHEEVWAQEGVDDGFFERFLGGFETGDVLPVHFVALDDDFVEYLLGGVGVDADREVLFHVGEALVPVWR